VYRLRAVATSRRVAGDGERPASVARRLNQARARRASTDDHAQRGFDFWVLRDPWGNGFCVLHPNFPELLARRRPWTT
jgi:Glyoxalase-like domain